MPKNPAVPHLQIWAPPALSLLPAQLQLPSLLLVTHHATLAPTTDACTSWNILPYSPRTLWLTFHLFQSLFKCHLFKDVFPCYPFHNPCPTSYPLALLFSTVCFTNQHTLCFNYLFAIIFQLPLKHKFHCVCNFCSFSPLYLYLYDSASCSGCICGLNQ